MSQREAPTSPSRTGSPSVLDHERIEIDYWRTTGASSIDPSSLESVSNILNKMTDAGVFLHAVLPYLETFRESKTVLEIGGGQGWASCLLKRLCPQTRFLLSDISPWAVGGLKAWEHIFDVHVDHVVCCRSYAIPLHDETVSSVFAFASAHHFRMHERTLAEIERVLEPGGRCLYLFEPSSPAFWYGMAKWRVNRKRPTVPEDVLVPSRMRAWAQDLNLELRIGTDPSLYKRAPIETIYYALLRRCTPLQRLLPCTMTYEFAKPIHTRS